MRFEIQKKQENMELFQKALVMLLVSDVGGVLIETTDLTIGVSPLDIRCSAANSGVILYVNSFTLHRNGTPVAKVTYNRTSQNTNVIVMDVTDNRARYYLTGNVHDPDPARKFLRVVVLMNQTACRDAANYTCVLEGQNQDHSTYREQVSKYVAVRTIPAAIDEIFTPPTSDNTLDPSGGGNFLVGSTYRFTCTGIVGKPPVSLRWCYKLKGDSAFNPLISYTADISESEPEIYQDCNNKRQSYLNYTMATLDVETVLLCEPYSGMYYCGDGAINKTFVVRAYPRTSGMLNSATHRRLSMITVTACFMVLKLFVS